MDPNTFLHEIKRQRRLLTSTNYVTRIRQETDWLSRRAIFWVLLTSKDVTNSPGYGYIANLAVQDDDEFVRMTALTVASNAIRLDEIPLDSEADDEFVCWLRAAARQRMPEILSICSKLIDQGNEGIRMLIPSIISEFKNADAIEWLEDFFESSANKYERFITAIGLLKCGERQYSGYVEASIHDASIPRSVFVLATAALLVVDSKVGFDSARRIADRGSDPDRSMLGVAIDAVLGGPVAKDLVYIDWINQYMRQIRRNGTSGQGGTCGSDANE